MKKTLAILLSLAMALCLLTACGGNTETTASSKPENAGTIKLGATGPLTGGAALYGIAVQRGAEIAVEEINALGGIKFDFRMEDDAHDAEKAQNAFNTLLDWNMQISLGSVTTAPGVATATIAAEENAFCLTPSGSGPAVTEAGKGNVFQVCFSDPNQGTASARYISEKKLGEKIAIIYKNDDPYSVGIYETFKAKADELGLNIVSTTTFTSDNEKDFSVQVADAKNNGADLLFLPMYYDPASLIITECNKIGYSVKFFGVDGMDGILSVKGFDTQLAEGVMLLTPFVADAKDDLTQKFVKKYQEKYNEVPIQFAADAYDGVYIFYEAAKAGVIKEGMSMAECCTAMKKFITGSFKFSGLTGEGMTWSEDGAVNKDPKGMRIENGVYVGMD